MAQNAQFLSWREGFQTSVENYSLREGYSALLRGDALGTALRYLAQRPGEFTPRETAFIHRSEAEAQLAAAVGSGAPQKRNIGLTIAGSHGLARKSVCGAL
jgi:hypothetical protein